MRILNLFLLLLCPLWIIAQQSVLEIGDNWECRKVGAEKWLPAEVPGCVHSDLLHNKIIGNPLAANAEKDLKWIEDESWEYKATIPYETLKGHAHHTLKFEGLDTYASVYWNEELVLQSDNMFRTYEIPINGVKGAGNSLRIVFDSPVKRGQELRDELGFNLPSPNDAGATKNASFSRKAPYQFGWDWGPRLLTSGIWKPVSIVGWDNVRLISFRIDQKEVLENRANYTAHFSVEASDEVKAEFKVNIPGNPAQKLEVSLTKGINHVEVPFSIIDPDLWWPNEAGSQRLYEVTGSISVDQKTVVSSTRKIGVRTIELIQEKDNIGTSFFFKVNGEPIFMKGANMIPQSVFPSAVSDAELRKLLVTAKRSHMNMLRVWGGGIYQSDRFYDLCDSLGILIWQDLMFAGSLYPTGSVFMENVKVETEQQITRIGNHACLALWCGNNEVDVARKNWGWQAEFGLSEKRWKELAKGYSDLFQKVIPEIVDSISGTSNYIHTSPLSNWGTPENFNHHNMHYWGVWHGPDNFDGFAENIPRFMSEYGFQSFPHSETLKAALGAENMTMDSPVLNQRQKSYKGTKELLRHLVQHYPEPKDLHDLAYLSQLNQRLAMRTAIDAHRLNRNKCMGTLYWQLNDVWAAPTWSTIDVDGRWKAAHYMVRDRYAKVITVAKVDGKNFTVSVLNDQLQKRDLTLKLRLQSFTGEIVWQQTETVQAKANGVTDAGIWPMKTLMPNSGLKALAVMRIELMDGDSLIAEELYYFNQPKNLNLSNIEPEIQTNYKYDHVELVITSPVLLKDVMVETDLRNETFSENYFDVMPNEPKVIKVFPKYSVPVNMAVKLKSLNNLTTD